MSTETKVSYTPGPWYVSGGDVNFANEVDGNRSGGTIATVYMRGERHRANARLIAKAPEMAEALKQVIAMAEREYQELTDGGYGKFSESPAVKKALGVLREAGAL